VFVREALSGVVHLDNLIVTATARWNLHEIAIARLKSPHVTVRGK
jgi:hypothetical protein